MSWKKFNINLILLYILLHITMYIPMVNSQVTWFPLKSVQTILNLKNILNGIKRTQMYFYIIQEPSCILPCGKNCELKKTIVVSIETADFSTFQEQIESIYEKTFKNATSLSYQIPTTVRQRLQLWSLWGRIRPLFFLRHLHQTRNIILIFLFLLLVRNSLNWYWNYLRDRKAFQVALKLDYLSK